MAALRAAQQAKEVPREAQAALEAPRPKPAPQSFAATLAPPAPPGEQRFARLA